MKHGGDLTDAIAQYGGAPHAWIDLSTGINPTAWPVPDAPLLSSLHRLPSLSDEIVCLDAARMRYRIPSGAEAVAAPGTQALIQWLPRLAPAGAVAIATTTYSEHAQAWADGGHQVLTCDTPDGLPDSAKHAVIVNPNNPDGHITPFKVIEYAAIALQERGGWLVVDEAFMDTEPDKTAASLCSGLPIVVLRSFGKFYGLAGIRLGVAIAPSEIASRIRRALGPWAVSTPALAIGAAALRDDDWTETTRRRLASDATRLDALLHTAGCTVVGGTPLFRLVRHQDALALHDRLARRHIWCRRFDHTKNLLRFGLPGNERDFARLADALG
jgi:cobalamin biosynthetic protein CobC